MTFETDVWGDSSASIMRIMLESFQCEGVFREGHVFILDRGFRDIFGVLQSKGFRVFIPSLSNGREQLAWQEANETRKVTINRWVVEAVIKRVKMQFRHFFHIIQNKDILSREAEYAVQL